MGEKVVSLPVSKKPPVEELKRFQELAEFGRRLDQLLAWMDSVGMGSVASAQSGWSVSIEKLKD